MSFKYQGARPGIMGALQIFAGGGDAYGQEMDRLTKRDALRYQMGADAAGARKATAEAAGKELVNSQIGKALDEIAGLAAQGKLPQGVTPETWGVGVANTTGADDMMKALAGLRNAGFGDEAATAARDGDIATLNNLNALIKGEQRKPYALSETGRLNTDTGAVDYTPGHMALEKDRLASAGANDALAAQRRLLEVSPGASVYNVGGLAAAPGGEAPAPVATAPVAQGAGKGYGSMVESIDENGNRVFIQPDKSGGPPKVVEGYTPPAKQTLTGKDAQTAQGKIMAAENLLRQIAIAREKFKTASESFGSTGVLGGRNPLDRPGQAFDASIDALRSSVSALTRVPGVGAMSDYETRLDQSKIPNRAQYDDVTLQKLDELEALAKGIQSGYGDMLGANEAAGVPTPRKPGAGPTVSNW